MKSEGPELIRGSGNVYRDFGAADADPRLFKAMSPVEITKALERDELTLRAPAQRRPGMPAADFSRIRNANLDRFRLDRLFGIINRLRSHVEVKLKIRRNARAPYPTPA